MQDTCINECHEVNCVEAGSGRGGLCWYGASLGLLKPIPLGNGGVELARASMLDRAVHKLGQPVGEVVQPGLALPSEKVGFWAELPTLNQPGKGANQAICAVEHRHNAATRLAEAPQSLLCPIALQHLLARCDFEGIGPILEGNDLHKMRRMRACTLCAVAIELCPRLSLH